MSFIQDIKNGTPDKSVTLTVLNSNDDVCCTESDIYVTIKTNTRMLAKFKKYSI